MPEAEKKITCALAEIVEAVVGTGFSDSESRTRILQRDDKQEISMKVLEIMERIKRDLVLLENWLEAGRPIGQTETALERLIADARETDGSRAISKKEKEVLMELASGKTNREISATLGKSEKTVKNHLWKIYRKLGVNNRTQLFNKLMKA